LSFISQFLKRIFATTFLPLLVLEQINKFDKPILTNFAMADVTRVEHLIQLGL
jgi:hypothetical protein